MYILDFAFDEKTGETKIVVDFFDESMNTMEMNLAIRDGEIRENITKKVGQIFGLEVEEQLRNGQIDLVCLDDHPEEKEDLPLSLVTENQDEEIQRKENII